MPHRTQQANAIRALSMDAVQQANSGHPGMPMGMATIAEVLWRDFLRHNPGDPTWPNRDRFVLSNGHGSMLLYSLLYLTGYDLGIADIKQFRQLHSKTPGHPEYGCAPGVETTTGPLGQGLANAVGMALAEQFAARYFNRPGYAIVDHFTYCFVGDGCLMEGISHEVCSLAGTLGLGKLIVIYDDNGISIDGEVGQWFTDNTPQRFAAYGWHVQANVNGHDPVAVASAITEAQLAAEQPSIICCKTTIGYGAPNLAGSEATHGAPLGADEVKAARAQLHWPYPAFEIPNEILASWNAREQGHSRQQEWQQLLLRYQQQYPQLAAEFQRRISGQLPATWRDTMDAHIQDCAAQGQSIATRKASQQTLNVITPILPELLGGSADLTGSNLTLSAHATQYLHYGVREFGMTAIMNGIALHGAFIPFGGTFLVFSDYARNAIRLSAMMRQRVIHVLTHDSIGLGEDGPTHQPIEHAASLRLVPGLHVWRPCDSVETAVAWQQAIIQQGPTALLLSRQTLKHQERSTSTLPLIARGGYILRDTATTPLAIIIATGSEVTIAVAASEALLAEGLPIRVVSMPATTVFDQQDAAYREHVLPQHITKRLAIEAGAVDYWYKYVGLNGNIIGMNRFGESAPADELFKTFGFTKENVIAAVKALL